MQEFIFDLQRFDTQEISAGDTYERDGVTYSAMADAVLNLDDDEKVSRLASGKVTAVVTSKINPQLTIDATDGAIEFSATDDDALAVTLSGRQFKFTEGTATVTSDKVTTGAAKFSIAGTHSQADYEFTVEDSAEFSITPEAFVISSEKFNVAVLTGGNTLNLEVSGTATRNFTNHTFSFSGGTTISNTFGDYTFSATANDDSGGGFSFTSRGITFTPENGGKLGISIAKGDNPIFSREFSVSGGSIFVNHANQTIGLTDGAKISFSSGGYEIIAKANGDASTVFSFADNGFTFTPNTGDGTLDVTIKNSAGSMTANVEILSGTFTFGENGALTVEKGTELQIKFSDDYIVNIKATDDAGGTIFLGTDGISFAPNSNDGNLEISVTKNGETRTASLEMTGSVTYKLDGSISLTQGTVIKSVFDDESSLTITANKNADAKMIFSPQDGLSITPSVPDALSVLLSAKGTDIIKLAEIDGTVTYSGGTFTASDGTEIHFVDPAGIYNDNVLRTAGGSTSLNFNTERIIYTANEGATFTMDYLQGTTWELQNGSITDFYSGAIQGLLSLSKGSTFDTNDSEYPFTLEKDGNYMLNTMQVNTSSENVDVLFSNYETVTINGISYTPLDEKVTLKTGDNGTTVSGGKVTMQADGFDKSLTFDTTKGSVSHVTEGDALLISTAADLQALAQRVNDGDDCTGLIFKLTGDIDMNSIENFTPIGNYASITDYNAFNGTFDGCGYTIRNLTINHPDETNQALFGDVDYGATIKNVNIVNASVTGKDDVGGLVGWNGGKIINCTVKDSTITGTNTDVGGIAGDSEGKILSCSATNTTVTGKKHSVGGLVGDNDGSIIISYAISPKVGTELANGDCGAVVGNNSGTINAYCYDCDEPTVGRNTGALPEITFVDKTQIDGLAIGKSARNDAGTFTVAAGTKCYINRGDQVLTFTAPKKISVNHYVDGGISYFDFDNDVTANISVESGGKTVFAGDLKFGGVISYNPASGTFGLTGANSSHGNGTNSFAQLNVNGYGIQMTTSDTTIVVVPTINNGRIDFNFPNARKHAMTFTLSKDGSTILEDQAVINGTVGFDIASKELHFTKGTVLTLGSGETSLEITALDDASGHLTFTDDGIRFAPNAGDGQLELNFVASDRKANIDVSAGALILNSDRTLSLEKGTVVNLTWEDGTKLTLTASDTGGSIGFDEQGLKVSSDGELSIDLTAGDVQTTLTGLQGTIHYNAGKVLFDKDSTLTATSTLGGQPVNITLESNGTGGYLEISAVGTNYVAGTGALAITWSRGDKSSTFSVSNGSVYIGHGVFKIAEGTSLSTDLKDLVPALYFTTSEAGTYTINGQTITTSAENISMTATDDYMTFKTSDNVVEYDGMTFAGDGNVSLTADNVVLGAGVVANGFGEGNSFVLAEAGNVTADAKIFQLDPLSLDDGREIPMIITVTGAQDGFIFSRTLTEESEEYLGYLDSPYVGSIFTEKFIAAGDNSYRIRTDPIGLEDVIGISDGASISGGAILDDEETLSYYVLVTDTTGDFTIGEKTYTLAKGTELGTGIRARFDVDSAPYADKVSDLNGTISGDFTEGQFSVNGGAGIKIFGDKDVSISANDNGVEIYGLSDKATLASVGSASKVHTDTTGEFVFGNTADDSLGLTVTGDPNVTFEFDLESQDIMAINDLEGSLQLSETSHLATINGITCDFDGKFSSVGAYDNALYLHDVSDGSSIITDDEDKIWLQQVGASMAVNTNEFTLAGDEDGIWIRDKEIVGLDEGASLKVSDAGNYTVNTANISAKAGDVIVGLENGNDAYIFNANNPLITKNTSASALVDIFNPENVSIVSASDKGRFDISLTGGDLAIVENTAARVNITAGDDTVVSQGKNVHLNLTGGDTWLFALGGKMTIDGYDLSSGTGFGTTYGDIVSAVKDGRIDFGNGKLSMSGAVADFNTQSQLVNFFDRNGTRQIVGFAGNYASLNASDSTDNLLLSGDKNSTLIAGSGNDTIFAAEGNFVDAGAGKNSIYIKERDENSSGVEINLDGGGNDTVHNFRTGFENSSDAIANNTGHWHNFFDGTNVTINTASGTAVLQNVGSGEAFMKLKEVDNGVEYKVAVAQKNSVIAAGADIANIYSGENSAVDFTGFSGSLSVNLTEGQVGNIGGENVYFYGINYVAAGDGLTTLIGSSDNDTLIAGNGYGSLWGGKGSDNLIGQADSSIKNGMTSFFFFAGDGNDTVSNFEFLTRENKISGNADKIAITADIVTRGKLSGDDVVLQLNDGDDYLTLEDAAGKNFRLNEYTVKVDKNISYDGFANCYVADGGSSLTVDSTVDSAEIWLDSSHGNLFFGNIRTLDASAVEGRTSLAGYALDETIIAGHGDSSLWGGVFGDDLLIGGESKNTFFYHLGDGNDTIQNAKEGDIVDLNTLTIDQVVGEIGADGVVLMFTDGGSLTVAGTDVEFRINNDGTTYVVDNGEWKTK